MVDVLVHDDHGDLLADGAERQQTVVVHVAAIVIAAARVAQQLGRGMRLRLTHERERVGAGLGVRRTIVMMSAAVASASIVRVGGSSPSSSACSVPSDGCSRIAPPDRARDAQVRG